jgi:hypothetical protein
MDSVQAADGATVLTPAYVVYTLNGAEISRWAGVINEQTIYV